MKLKKDILILILSIPVILSFQTGETKHSEVFLSLNYKMKVPIYRDASKLQIIKQIGNNYKDEDYLLFTICDRNDSMYQVIASYAIEGKGTKGWISKTAKLSVFSKAYSKKLVIYHSPDKKAKRVYFNYISKELDVLDYTKGWLKIKVTVNKVSVIGWLPQESQCGNPYTTCS